MDPNAQQPTAPQSPPVIVTPESRRKSHVLPIALAGLTLLILGLAGGYFVATSNKQPVTQNTNQVAQVSPTPNQPIDETANWEMYENKEKGYTVKYPSEKLIRLLCPGEELILQKRVPGNESQDEKPLETCGRDSRFDIEIVTTGAPSEEQATDKNYVVKKEKITVANQPAEKYTVTPTASCFGICAPVWRQEIRFNNNGTYYTFHLSDKDLLSDFDHMLTTFKITNPISTKTINTIVTPTPDLFVNWKNYSDTKYHFSFKYPTDWTTQMKDYPENNQRLINIIKNTSPNVVSLSFTIKNDWSNTGDAESQPQNYSVGGVPAYRLDPPTKQERQLERYQTNVYVENAGNVYIFMCTHNWDQNYINTCNNILSTTKFTN